ncbi:MAG: chloride channel protein [Ruminococcaceae bacterium]|nr:chloride channel protein [Oscillospiraceae bacterium]
MNLIKQSTKTSLEYIKIFLKWTIIAAAVGSIGGVLGSLFHEAVELVTGIRMENSWLVYLLPVGGLLIVALYSLSGTKLDTNRVIESIRTEKDIPWYMAPFIFVGTVITHLLGGSAGREGAALQVGGCIGYNLGKIIKLNKSDLHIIVMAGMSAVFTAMFGTPMTAVLFALEVTSVGVIYYAGLLPCVVSSLVAYGISVVFGLSPVAFSVASFPSFTVENAARVGVLSLLCAIVCVVFCFTMKKSEEVSKRFLKNGFLRIFIGGLLIVGLTVLCGSNDYNGAGMHIIERAIGGEANTFAFILKIVFTSITVAAGFKGGEIVPTFFIGATFGCVVAPLLGLDPGFGAAIGFIALFCGVVNCPIASLMLAFEVFGGVALPAFMIACAISYMMSGYTGLYKSQKIVYSKLEAKYVDTNVN